MASAPVTIALDRTVRIMKVTGFAERRGDASKPGARRREAAPPPAMTPGAIWTIELIGMVVIPRSTVFAHQRRVIERDYYRAEFITCANR